MQDFFIFFLERKFVEENTPQKKKKKRVEIGLEIVLTR